MTIDMKKLRELAQSATPGPWTHDAQLQRTNVRAGAMYLAEFDCDAVDCSAMAANAAFVAAANPQTVLALLDLVEAARAPEAHWECQQRIDRLEEQLAAANAEIERLRAVYEAAARFPEAYGGRLVEPPGDWACRECRPDSDWPNIDEGWRCPIHALLAALAAKEPGRG